MLKGGFFPVIGLELHAQLAASRKLFSFAPNLFAAPPNTLVARQDAALPGSLPRLNWECVDLAARAGLALGCVLHRESRFDRKHYFYPDQPAGYQITQQRAPLCTAGAVEVALADGSVRRVRVARVQMEQDTGKMIHERGGTLLDLNRAGAALVEIVSEPDMRSADEAVAYVVKVARLLQFIGSCDADMSKGNLRVDVNVSLAHPSTAHRTLGVRCEIKNLNSLVRVRDAVEYELGRQAELIESGQTVERETRGWNTRTRKTFALRDKEMAVDYRFMREPDVPPLRLTDADVARIRGGLTETPEERVARYAAEFGLGRLEAEAMALEPASNRFFEAVMATRRGGGEQARERARVACIWMTHELTGLLHGAGLFSLDASPVKPEQLSSLVDALLSGTVTGAVGKRVLRDMFEKNDGATCEEVVRRNGWSVLDKEDGEMVRVANAVVERSPGEAQTYRQGDENKKQRVMKYFMGQAMKDTKGRADPEQMKKLVERALEASSSSLKQ